MTISISIIIFIAAAVGFWLYFRKNKERIEKRESPSMTKKDEYALTNLDKMLDNLSSDDKKGIKNDTQTDLSNHIEESINDNKNQNDPIDFGKMIKGSIILERKKKK